MYRPYLRSCFFLKPAVPNKSNVKTLRWAINQNKNRNSDIKKKNMDEMLEKRRR